MVADNQNRNSSLQGVILAYSESVNSGLIRDTNGDRYLFERGEWQSPDDAPRDGLPVTFTASRAKALAVMTRKTLQG